MLELRSKTSGSNPPLHSEVSAGREGSVRERLSGDEEMRPVTATQYKYGIVGGGGEERGVGRVQEGPSVKQLQVSDGNFALLVASLAHQPVRIHPRDAADRDHLQ